MNITLIILIAFAFIKADNHHDSFLHFNMQALENTRQKYCRNPEFLINMANIEESKHENRDKIILYHGESYGTWLFQMILKEFMFPEAPEDWLPLRYKSLKKDIDKTDLMKMIKKNHLDSAPKYAKLGLAVSINLVSQEILGESAWYFICHWPQRTWHKLEGLNFGGHSLHASLNQMIKKKFIPMKFWKHFQKQKKLLYAFVQVKRDLKQIQDFSSLYNDIQTFFPETFASYKQHLESLPNTLKKYQSREKDNSEGVALQIIMKKDLADRLAYLSKEFGWVKSRKIERYIYAEPWQGDEIEPFSEIYEEDKNKKDYSQARLAMNNDFRSFPSKVFIKSIAGIMENPTDYEILKSMIKEMVKENKKMEVPSSQKSSWLSTGMNCFNNFWEKKKCSSQIK